MKARLERTALTHVNGPHPSIILRTLARVLAEHYPKPTLENLQLAKEAAGIEALRTAATHPVEAKPVRQKAVRAAKAD